MKYCVIRSAYAYIKVCYKPSNLYTAYTCWIGGLKEKFYQCCKRDSFSKANSETGKTCHPTCCSEVNVDVPSTARGADAAGVLPLVTECHTPQQQRGIPRGQSIEEELSSPFELRVLVGKIRSSILIEVNGSRQALLLPGDWHVCESGWLTFSVQKAAEKLILAEVGNGQRVGAYHLGQGACGKKTQA